MTDLRKKLIAVMTVLSVAGTAVLSSCGNDSGSASSTPETTTTTTAAETTEATTTTTTATAEEETPKETDWEKLLSSADGVVKVEEITMDPSAKFFSKKYMLTFEQPLDWSKPETGTFPQRVEVGIVDGAIANVMNTDGYCLFDNVVKIDDPTDMCIGLGGNLIHVEHRFFGESRPEDMSNDDVKYWEYHTSENAANDYHRIYTSLSAVMGENWVADGTSRGGLMTNVYAYYYPEDMLLYVPHVAPFSDGMDDPRMYKYAYTEIGNDVYGEETAKEMRDIIKSFQVDLYKNKDEIFPKYKDAAEKEYNVVLRDGFTFENLFDLNVTEFALAYWQGSHDFNELAEVLAMPETNEEEIKAKADAELKMLLAVQTPTDWTTSSFAWPYYVNTAMEYGQYAYDFSYVRDELKEAGLEDKFSITKDMEKDFLQNAVFTKEQKEKFVYDGTLREKLIKDLETTKAKHLMIYGGVDPWTCLRLPDVDNENVKVIIVPEAAHEALVCTITDEKQAAEAKEFIQEALAKLL